MKAYTDKKQSKKLAEILPLESADMGYIPSAEDDDSNTLYTAEYKSEVIFDEDCIPCWSLAALLCVLPILERKGYQKAKPRLLYNVAINKWIVDSHIYTTDAYDNPVDACYEIALKLYERKIL